MTMKFYDALQMDPSVLKRKIASCDTKHDRAYYWTAIAVRSVLIVGFAIVFISLLSGIFGSDNTPLAVALFCMMLGIRFVNFEYCIRDSLAALAAVLAILVLVPSAAAVFSDSTPLRSFFCLAVHDHATSRDGKRRFIQLCLYLPDRESGVWGGTVYVDGICLCIAAVGVPIFRQYTCPLPASDRRRCCRILRFFVIYLATPEAFHPLMGPLGGICLGFCTDYRYKTAMNCFGALMLGAGIYGLQGAVVLRIMDTFLGVTFGLIFAAVFHRLAAAKFLSEAERE